MTYEEAKEAAEKLKAYFYEDNDEMCIVDLSEGARYRRRADVFFYLSITNWLEDQ